MVTYFRFPSKFSVPCLFPNQLRRFHLERSHRSVSRPTFLDHLVASALNFGRTSCAVVCKSEPAPELRPTGRGATLFPLSLTSGFRLGFRLVAHQSADCSSCSTSSLFPRFLCGCIPLLSLHPPLSDGPPARRHRFEEWVLVMLPCNVPCRAPEGPLDCPSGTGPSSVEVGAHFKRSLGKGRALKEKNRKPRGHVAHTFTATRHDLSFCTRRTTLSAFV